MIVQAEVNMMYFMQYVSQAGATQNMVKLDSKILNLLPLLLWAA